MKLIIIGGGIAGLTAGIYARQSGIDTAIYEMHTLPGGNSTSWRRKGYLFEGGMHWLTGSSNDASLHLLWKETGALQENNPIYNRDPFLTYMEQGETICLYRDPDKLKEHLLRISPRDEKAILTLIRDIKLFRHISVPVTDVKGVRVRYKSRPSISMLFHVLRAMKRMNELNSISCREYLDQFTHPGIRTLLNISSESMAANSIAFTLGSLASGDSGYPRGGSLRMAQNMADTFLALGGTLQYGKKVQSVRVTDGKAAGIVIDGLQVEADAVLITADARSAIDSLFEIPLLESWTEEMRKNVSPMNCSFLSIGVRTDLSALPENLIFPLQKPLVHGGFTHHAIGINNYARFAGYAPSGCTALTIPLMGDTYDYWKRAEEDGTYAEKKQKLADEIIRILNGLIPRTEGAVDVWDVATPLTYERYCGAWRGSWMSVMKPGGPNRYPLCSESIRNLYFAGQRMAEPGGLPTAATTGREAVQYLCRDHGIVFQKDYERPC